MPAAQPTKASISNVLKSVVASGLLPGGIRVHPDGSFFVDIAGNKNEAPIAQQTTSMTSKAASTEKVACDWEDGK